ncbi:MAG: hypothetical protein SOY89_04900 [Dysosmobacter sp.]|nr:hypothetical protein [Dysosmobacter sp.]
MKKNWISFLSGMMTMAMLVTLIVPAGAAGIFNGKAGFGKVGVEVYDQVKAAPGASMTAANGEKVPVTITYTDAKGGTTNYIAVKKVAELFDMSQSPKWDGEKNCVNFFPVVKTTGVIELKPGEKAPANLPEGTVTVTHGKTSELEAIREKEFMSLPTAPKLGISAGPIREVNVSQVDNTNLGYSLKNARFESDTGVSETFFCPAGKYALLTIKNESSCEIECQVMRPYTVGSGGQEFTRVRIPVGQTLERAFYCSPGAGEFQQTLAVGLRTMKDGAITKVLISAETTR